MHNDAVMFGPEFQLMDTGIAPWKSIVVITVHQDLVCQVSNSRSSLPQYNCNLQTITLVLPKYI